MKIIWQIDPGDVARVRAFYQEHSQNAFVKFRIRANLSDDKPPLTKALIWERIVCCLLTTQQRSGPKSAAARFHMTQPCPLEYSLCAGHPELALFAEMTLKEFGGLRRFTVIGRELSANMNFLENGGWEKLLGYMEPLRLQKSAEQERQAAAFIDESLKGFGPKQSRNLLQAIGLSRYEIPLDSRIMGWLNEFGFPVHLSAKSLQDPDYYNFVSDGFQRLCAASDLVPCLLDAAIFSSYDNGQWTEENLIP